MFDHVGIDPDKEAGKRRAQSVGITLLTAGLTIGGSIVLATYTAVQILPDLLDDMEMVELVMEDIVEEAPPPPPPPPPGPEEEEEDEEDEAEPDEMDEEIEELDKEPEKEVKDAKGAPKGEEGGVVGGVIGGVVGGVVGGQLSGVHVLHHSEVEVKKRTDPRYPKSAKDMNLGDQRCLAKVFIDESGAPYKVLVENCPKVFHGETQAAIMKWRWYPPRVGREKVKAQITIAINYKVR